MWWKVTGAVVLVTFRVCGRFDMRVVSSAQSLRQELAQVSRSLTDRKAQQGSSSRGVFSLPLPPQAGEWPVKPYSLLQVQGFSRAEALPQHVVSDPLFEIFSVLESSQVAFQRGVKLFRYRTDSVNERVVNARTGKFEVESVPVSNGSVVVFSSQPVQVPFGARTSGFAFGHVGATVQGNAGVSRSESRGESAAGSSVLVPQDSVSAGSSKSSGSVLPAGFGLVSSQDSLLLQVPQVSSRSRDRVKVSDMVGSFEDRVSEDFPFVYAVPRELLFEVSQCALAVSSSRLDCFEGYRFNSFADGTLFLSVVPFKKSSSFVNTRILAVKSSTDFKDEISSIVNFWVKKKVIPSPSDFKVLSEDEVSEVSLVFDSVPASYHEFVPVADSSLASRKV